VGIATCLSLPNEVFCLILSQEHRTLVSIAQAIADSGARTARSSFADELAGTRKSVGSESNGMRSESFGPPSRRAVMAPLPHRLLP
jgi:hypothetical protein